MVKRLRAVVVTNQGHPEWEDVVIAVEMYPWHETPAESRACPDHYCCNQLHRRVVMPTFTFDFDAREILVNGRPASEDRLTARPIPEAELAKWGADFGVYYAS